METRDHGGDLFDLSLSIGGRFKLLQNYSENLMLLPEVAEGLFDFSMGLELEFNNADLSVFYFSIPTGLFKVNRREGMSLVRLDTQGMGAPTALSMSDKGYLLVGFTCGSIG